MVRFSIVAHLTLNSVKSKCIGTVRLVKKQSSTQFPHDTILDGITSSVIPAY